MNFYEYHQGGDETLENPVAHAAASLIAAGLQVIPLLKNDKAPATSIRDVYKLMSNPINDKNFSYYFEERDVDLGLILADDMEFLDIDEKYKPGIVAAFLQAIEFSAPDIYEKLTIHYTKNNGCHLLYRAEVVGGTKVLARTPNKPNPLAIIERINRSNSQYIKIPPSEGYSVHQRSPMDIQYLTAEERNFLCALAMSFNEVHIPEVKQQEAEREDSPWFVFNSRKDRDWKWMRGELQDRGWQIVQESDQKLTLRRPGTSDHRSSGYLYKDKNMLYLHTTSTEFENGKPYSPFGLYAMFYHDNDTGRASRQLASEGCGRNLTEEGQFWKRTKTSIEIKYTELLNWLEAIGYRRYQNSIVQVINNIVSVSSIQDMKRAFINEVEFEIRDKMYNKVSVIFSDEGGLMAMLPELDDNFICDGPEHTWLFFQNLVIKITDKIEPYEYKDLDGYIWASDIIARQFHQLPFAGCDADRFVSILGGEKKSHLMEIIGYNISRYKDPLNARATLLMEDISVEDEGDSQGGSGKGLLFQFIKQYRKSADYDGKNFKPGDPFLYQNIDPDTSIIFIDDVDKSFRFSSLFSIITNSLQVNKKNKPQLIIPFEKSPKLFITSNYSIGGQDQSTRRRKYEFAVVKHFGESLHPVDEFGRRFFIDWDRAEWLMFDNLIAECCRMYLCDTEKRDIGNVTANSLDRNLINNTNKEFVEYMDNQLACNFFDFAPAMVKNRAVTYPDGTYVTNAVDFAKWVQNRDSTDYYMYLPKEEFFKKIQVIVKYKNLTTTRLTQWLNRWADARKVQIDPSYIRVSDRERCYRIIDFIPTT